MVTPLLAVGGGFLRGVRAAGPVPGAAEAGSKGAVLGQEAAPRAPTVSFEPQSKPG